MLKFQVQGSATEPYRVTADGSGVSLRMFCSCPAGRKGGNPCKHIKAVLQGQASNFVQPSDDLGALSMAAQGSPYLEWAANYTPPPERQRVANCATMEEAFASYGRQLEAAGWRVEFVEDCGDFPTKTFAIYRDFKNGKQRKTPSVQLEWAKLAWDSVVTETGGDEKSNIRPRVRPFSVRGGGDTIAFAAPDRAMHVFLERAGLLA